MKNKFAKRLINYGFLIALVAMMVGQSAKAQTLAYGLRVNIPFAFTVGSKTLPAGRYSVNRVSADSESQLIQISSLDGKANTFRTTIPVTTTKPKVKGTLVFHRYGDQYFLFQVWPAGGTIGRTLPRSRSERDLQEKQFVGLSTPKEIESNVVSLVADLP